MKRLIAFLILIKIFLNVLYAQPDIEKRLQTQMIMVEDGGMVEITEGVFNISKSLSMDGKKNIVIRGKGVDKTILSFKNQKTGAEGIKITNCENITIEDMTVQDSKGDLIKTLHVKGITFRRVKAEWLGKPKKTNGGYALYPVQCENVEIDNCTAIGASDAGIYVGQSKYIVVKNCLAKHNVAGIEIENSLYAEVFNNTATENTGGILVFDLPDLVLKKGGFTRVFNNKIFENNLSNFAPKGNIVGKVPKGTGVLILATNNVEVFDNQIVNNKSTGVGIISYLMTENPIKDKEYYPYPSNIYVHDNYFERRKERATSEGRFGKMFLFKLKFGKNVPFVMYDGIPDKNANSTEGGNKICVKNNKNQSVANINAANDFKNINKDPNQFDCTLERIQPFIALKTQ